MRKEKKEGNEFLQQATPKQVAVYRAGRLRCQTAVDLCCGLGNDAIALAKNCRKVFAFDNSKEVLEAAGQNALLEKAANIEFEYADAFKVDLGKINPNVVFADPSRRVNGVRVKELNKTSPDTQKLIEFLEKSGIENFCIEVSGSLDPSGLPGPCEKEFISLDHEPNCITLYFGSLRKCKYSIVVLPQRKRLEADNIAAIPDFESPKRYLFELDRGVVQMKMQGNLLQEVGKRFPKVYPFNESFFSSDNKAESHFFKNTFKIVKILEDGKNLKTQIQRAGGGKIVLRGRFETEDEQLKLKKELEDGLYGKRKLHVFFFGKMVIIAMNVLLK